jgi:Tfp pilus assembly PilM family ATPase
MKNRISGLVDYFTAPQLPRRAISIEDQHIAVASVAKRRERLIITGAAREALPFGLIEPRFVEANIKDKDRVSSLIGHAVEKAGLLRERRWSLAIPRKATRTFIIQLDEAPKSKKELAEVLQWRVERLLEVSMSELTAAFQRLSPAGGQDRYLVVAVFNEVVASYEALLAPLKIQPRFVIPAHLAEAAWLQLDETDKDALLIAAEPEELAIVFLRGGDVLSLRSVEFAADTLADEIHRTLVYYLDKLAPQGESGPEPKLGTVLLIGTQLTVGEVEASCGTLFPADRLPIVHTLREEKLDGHGELTLEAIASAAGLAAMGL